MNFVGRQFLEFTEWQSLELQSPHPKANFENRRSSVSVVLENRQSSVSAIGRILGRFVPISVSLLLPAGAGVGMQTGSESMEVTHVVTTLSVDL